VPIYEYRCTACGHTFEVVQKFSDAPRSACEVCDGAVEKVLHPVAIHFKGSGFYTTDYKRSPAATRPAASDDSNGKKTAGGEAPKDGAAGGPAVTKDTKATAGEASS